MFILYTSISSFCTLPLVLLNSISGWKKPSLLSALCQPDKDKLTGCQFPFDPKVSLGKRKIFSAWNQAGVLPTRLPLYCFLQHTALTGSFFPTGFLKALFDLTLRKISCQTHMYHIHMNINISSFRLPQYYIRGSTSFLFSHYTTTFWKGKHHSFLLSISVGRLLKKKKTCGRTYNDGIATVCVNKVYVWKWRNLQLRIIYKLPALRKYPPPHTHTHANSLSYLSLHLESLWYRWSNNKH